MADERKKTAAERQYGKLKKDLAHSEGESWPHRKRDEEAVERISAQMEMLKEKSPELRLWKYNPRKHKNLYKVPRRKT